MKIMEMKNKYLHPVGEETYETIKKLVLGIFHVKCKDRTNEQKNAALRFWRHKNSFSVENGILLFNGKKVLQKGMLQSVVKRGFIKSRSCGARPLSVKLKRNYCGISERQVLKQYSKSKEYQRQYPKFCNKPSLKPVTARKVNERWQIDLLNMNNDYVIHNGKTYRYILSVLDVFSRFVILRSLKRKTSRIVARELEKIFSEHGKPSIIQCDQGTEFKGRVKSLLAAIKVKVIRSRPYHPQSQGKCERSHRIVRNKINYLKMRKHGFNWARDLDKVQSAINESPKEVLGYSTPSEVYTSRNDEHLFEKVREASQRCSSRNQRRALRKGGGLSVYAKGEHVLVRFPSGARVPKRRYVVKGKIVERKLKSSRYKVRFRNAEGNIEECWKESSDITSITKDKEETRRKVTHFKANTKRKYLIPLSESDKMKELDIFKDDSIQVIENPRDTASCQFASVSHQLRLCGIYRTSLQLRMEAVQHIEQWRKHYAEFIDERFENYTTKMRSQWEYGDHLTLIALAREYNVQFLIISNAGIDHTRIISNNDRIDAVRPTLTLGHFPEHHYVSIKINAETLQQIIEGNNAEVGDSIQEIGSTDNQPNSISEKDIGQSGDGNHGLGRQIRQRNDEVGRNSAQEIGQGNDGEREGRVQEIGQRNHNFGGNSRHEIAQRDDEANGDDREHEIRKEGDGVSVESGNRIRQTEDRVCEDSEHEIGQRDDEVMEYLGQKDDEEGEDRIDGVHGASARKIEQRDNEMADDNVHEIEQQDEVDNRTNICLLPAELWTLIIQHRLRQDPSSRYTLMYVNKMFRNIIRTIPLPTLHISPDVILNVPRIISVRRIIRASGRNSGLVMEIKAIIRNTRWANSWLHLRERENRWFDITFIWCRLWRYNVERVAR